MKAKSKKASEKNEKTTRKPKEDVAQHKQILVIVVRQRRRVRVRVRVATVHIRVIQ